MYTTVNNEGLFNNYSIEPEVYYAEFPSSEQQNRALVKSSRKYATPNFVTLGSAPGYFCLYLTAMAY